MADNEPSKSPRTMTDDQRHLALIEGHQRDCDAAEQQYEQAKAEAASLKKVWEKKVRKMFEFIRSLNVPMPLFEVWKQTPVDELSLPEGVIMLLEEAGYDTVGKIAEFTEKGGKLTDIPHIGEAKAEAIRKALDIFWANRKADGEV